MTKFNFSRGTKTPKGTKPRSTRMITPDHDAYKIYLRGLELRKAKGLPYLSNLTQNEVNEAIESFKSEKVS